MCMLGDQIPYEAFTELHQSKMKNQYDSKAFHSCQFSDGKLGWTTTEANSDRKGIL